ncbi:hypothetical protein [Nonomuraea sp. NPDC049158]|uniref:RNA polymerase sigma factor n=1 Tax=Nonomuraea sp. NPDC049158 TaxID=3155649 RepID=UPI0033EC9C49
MSDASRPGPEVHVSPPGNGRPDHADQFLEAEHVLIGEDIGAELDEAIDAVERDLATHAEERREDRKEERERRLEADRRLVALLKTENFAGPQFNRLASAMAGYGWPILLHWLRTGEIFRRVASRCRCPVKHHAAARDWTLDDRRQIATDTVLEGVEIFRRQLQADRYKPEKGASLKTYFVGSCICAFCKVYGLWWREQTLTDGVLHYACIDDLESAKVSVQSRTVDPEENAVMGDLVHRAISSMEDRDLRRVVGLRAIGYTQREAAAETGLSEKAAERRLARFRQRPNPVNPPDPSDAGEGRGEIR